MAATSKVRIYCETIGEGSDEIVPALASISDTPTKHAGPIKQTFTSAVAPIDVIGVVCGELIGLCVKALSSGLYVNPYASTPMTTQCGFIPEGQFNYYTFKTTVSCVPFAQAQTSTAKAELWFVAVS